MLENGIVEALGSLALALISWGVAELALWLRKKGKSEFFINALQRVGWAVEKAVAGVHQEYVAAIKEGKSDGKLTAAEKDEAKRRAVAKLKAYLDLNELIKLFSLKDISEADGVLGSLIEAEIANRPKTPAP